MQYVCKGECGGVSGHPGTCQAETCSHYQKELQPAEETEVAEASNEEGNE